MDCRGCGRSLTPGARFCAWCGVATSRVCRSCGDPVPADAGFCPTCGTEVAHDSGTAASAPRATDTAGRERKVATLLFADLVGYTNLNETLDPELVSTLVSGTFERLSLEVGRYEGTVEKFAGDALLAVFGVPAAHEDDPERAVRAALELQAVMAGTPATGDSPTLQLRIGIETGEVLVDRARATVERDLFVTGDAVNTAARLQEAADPGAVVVGPSTYAATRRTVEYEELPARELKGKAAPVAAWRAVAVKTRRAGERAPLGLESPLVGRARELTMLKEALRQAVEDGRPHLVTVLGSAGVGKSRLAWELEKYIDGLPEDYHWRRGRCVAYSGSSFEPIAEITKLDAHVADDDSLEVTQEKLASRLAELPLGTERAATDDALQALLGVAEQRERSREELFEGWRRYLGAIARVEPLVLVVEDLHWADDGVLSFLDSLARWGEGPMVILCLARHELLERRGGWGGGLPGAVTIVLGPLEVAANAALLDGLLQGGAPEPVRKLVQEHAEGNPLFTEEMVRMLLDRGVLRFSDGRWQLAGPLEAIEIPDSVQAVLAARLDTLPDEEKRVAQYAAVVGRIFWDVPVARLGGWDLSATAERIRSLRVKDLVVPRQPSAFSGAMEFGFRHSLVRDVAYDSLPKRDRARLHRDVARWAETGQSKGVGGSSELIAGHLAAALGYEEGLATGSDPGLAELRRCAYEAALQAARRASALSQLASAGRWLHLAIDLARRIGLHARDIAALAVEYSDAVLYVAEPRERQEVASVAIEGLLAIDDRTADDAQTLARLRCDRGHALNQARDVEGARVVLAQGIAELSDGPVTAGLARLHHMLAWTYVFAGPLDDAYPLLELATAEAEATGDAQTLRWARHDQGLALCTEGRSDTGTTLVEESCSLARQATDRNLMVRCATNLPEVRWGRGDALRPILTMTEDGLRGARQADSLSGRVMLAGNAAAIYGDMGRVDDALARANEAVSFAGSFTPTATRNQLVVRAIIHRLRGDVTAAEQDESAAMGMAPDREPQMAYWHLLGRAWARWPTDPPTAAHGLLSTPAGTGLTVYQRPWLAIEAARMALRLDDRSMLDDAVEQVRSLPEPGGPALRAIRAWAKVLADPDGDELVEAVAAELEEVDHLRRALDAWADAALLAARRGRSSGALDRAMALAASTGLQPPLGPLPETRWLGRRVESPPTRGA